MTQNDPPVNPQGQPGQPDASAPKAKPAPPPPTKPSIEALYGVAAQTFLTPYPSDRYTVPDASTHTGLRVHIDSTATADPSAATAGYAATEGSAVAVLSM